MPAEDVRLCNETTQKIYPNDRRNRTQDRTGNRSRNRTLGTALLITLAAAALPGSGHLALRRKAGWFVLGGFLLLVVAAAAVLLRVPRSELVGHVLSTRTLAVGMAGCAVVALAWLVIVLHTYMLARPYRLSPGKQFTGAFVVTVLCFTVAAPFGFAFYTANAQRSLLNALFPSSEGAVGGSKAGDVEAIKKPRINVFLVGSDAGSGRIGTRTDTMVVASIDTRSGRTTLFSLPRNIAHAPFPPGSAMAEQFPNGFNDPHDSASGLLNGVYAYGTDHPQLAPDEPSRNTGLNLLMSTIGHILGLDLDFYIQVDMNGFASIIDALGGLDVNVGAEPVPMGGIGPFGEEIRPFGYIPAGQQHLSGDQALWFARSRKNSSDYVRMGRQRCLLQYLIDQKSPIDVLRNFQAVADATENSVSTNIPQQLLPALMELAEKARARSMESIAFDPSLPDPGQNDGRFNTGDPDYQYVRQVVRKVIESANESTTTSGQPTVAAQPPSANPAAGSTGSGSPSGSGSPPAADPANPSTPTPVSLGEACSATETG